MNMIVLKRKVINFFKVKVPTFFKITLPTFFKVTLPNFFKNFPKMTLGEQIAYVSIAVGVLLIIISLFLF